jgi:hypothetical protein
MSENTNPEVADEDTTDEAELDFESGLEDEDEDGEIGEESDED